MMQKNFNLGGSIDEGRDYGDEHSEPTLAHIPPCVAVPEHMHIAAEDLVLHHLAEKHLESSPERSSGFSNGYPHTTRRKKA